MEKEIIPCRIWATEMAPDRHIHNCHAESFGLAGQVYLRDDIEKVLKDKPTLGGHWEMRACEPNHNGSACKECLYKHHKGLSYCYGSHTPLNRLPGGGRIIRRPLSEIQALYARLRNSPQNK